MSIQSKKIDMAQKLYTQNSKGGKGASPKFKTNSKSKGNLNMKYTQNGKNTGKGGGQPVHENGTKHDFSAKYKQAAC